MKKMLPLIALLFLTTSAISQKLDFILFDTLTKKPIATMDDYLIDYYGYEKLNSNEEGTLKTYARTYNDDLDNTIVITVQSETDGPNIVEVTLAQNYGVFEIKDQLISQGYKYMGTKNFEFAEFIKDSTTFLVATIPNEYGRTQIKVLAN